MSNIIPPLLSSSPPPMVGFLDDEEDDEFGDFAAAVDLSFGCDALSLPSTPRKSPRDILDQSVSQSSRTENNSTGPVADTEKQKIVNENSHNKSINKDFQDRRKLDKCSGDTVSNINSVNFKNQEVIHNSVETPINITDSSLISQNSEASSIEPKVVGKNSSKENYSSYSYFSEVPPDLDPDTVEDDIDEFRNDSHYYSLDEDDLGFTENDKETKELDLPSKTETLESVSCVEQIKETDLASKTEILENGISANETKSLSEDDDGLDRKSIPPKFAQPITSEETCTLHEIKNTKESSTNESEEKCSTIFKTETVENTSPVNVSKSSHPVVDSHTSCDNITSDLRVSDTSHQSETEIRVDSQFGDSSSNSDPVLSQLVDRKNVIDDDVEDEFGDFTGKNDVVNDGIGDTFEGSTSNKDVINGGIEDEFGDFLGKKNTEDEFGDFANHSEILQDNEPSKIDTAGIVTEDLFDKTMAEENSSSTNLSKDHDKANLSTAVELTSESEKPVESIDTTTDNELTNEPDDDFGDFHECATSIPKENSSNASSSFDSTNAACSKIESATDDFGDFETAFKDSKPVDGDEEFGNFDDYSSQSATFKLDADNILQKTESIIVDVMFPKLEQCVLEADVCDFRTNNVVFDAIKEITDTNALSYQWSKSCTQKSLLNSLNIDTRNILYGPRWNESMPRYAATLGFTPLEPVKSDVLPTLPLQDTDSCPSTSVDHVPSPSSNDIPTAQFDWSSSGLTNPLESSTKEDIEQLKSNLESYVAESMHMEGISKLSEDSEFSYSQKPDTESLNSLQFADDIQINVPSSSETFNDKQRAEDFDFNEIKTLNKYDSGFNDWSSNMVPLRETHIVSVGLNLKEDVQALPKSQSNEDGIEPGWLKPTIVTPDLPRREPVETHDTDEDDEFADFQAGLPQTGIAMQPQNELSKTKDKLDAEDDEFSGFQSVLPTAQYNSVPALKIPMYQQKVDELVSKTITPGSWQPVTLTSQPLQPMLVNTTQHPQPIQSNTVFNQGNISAQINWPDPGITDDDIRYIELNYKPKTEDLSASISQQNQVQNVPPSMPKTDSKSDDENDWSDFMSSQPMEKSPHNVVSPKKHINQVLKSPRVSTPELQLSVPQLNQIQPPKKPIPLITPQGLIQTKLSANMTIRPSIEPLVQPSVQQSKIHQNGYQPSLISDQFTSQLFRTNTYSIEQSFMTPDQLNQHTPQGSSRSTKTTFNQQTFVPSVQPSQYYNQQQLNPAKLQGSSTENKTQDEPEEEWSDFVSSQPAPASTNGWNSSQSWQNLDWNRPPQFTSWSSNVTPNIITNPGSFDSFQSYLPSSADLLKNKVPNKKNPNVVLQPKKSTIPSISNMPDLDFIGLKNKSWKK